MTRVTHKRGDTLSWTCCRGPASARVDLTGYTIAAQVRRKTAAMASPGALVETLTVVVDADQTTNPGKFVVSATASQTAAWLVDAAQVVLVCDIQYTSSGGQVSSSATFEVLVVEDITQ